MNKIFAFTVFSAALLVSACVSVRMPEGYAEMEYTGQYDQRAVSTQGNFLTLTQVKNQDKKNGTLLYWAAAMKNQFTLSRGYEFKEEGDFKSGVGPGKWQQYAHKFKGTDYIYIVGLVVDGSSVYVMEATGETARFEKEVPAIRKAFETLD